MGSSAIDDMESILKELPSYAIYEQFSKLFNEKFCQENFTKLLKLQDQNSNITEFCHNISGIIQHMSKNKEGNYISENCAYVNFYIYDRIKIKFNPYSEVVNNILRDIYLEWYLMNLKLLENKCSFKYHYNNNEIEEWNDMKIIYDYTKNYNYIKDNTNDYDTCKKYEKYLNKVKTIYEKKNSECCNKDNGQCKIYSFECKTIKHPDMLLQKINCPGLAKDNSRETQADRNNASSDNGPLKTSMVAIGPFIGILVSFFFFYKFSPLGPWLRNKIHQNINIKHISDQEDTKKSLAYTTEYAYINSDDMKYNISYQHV
ncbi:PIR Superfamily Protein [Plasmodium ovale wallikeri]|uniref:PIR Superfamily Protein n=1 Tax=Plasmodium ovale wallikeri TaxID=864142 RepID=A0A1A8YZ40_PLAOA|nr:PIR Superfamily Protein [Plasmodium ovale wallikeri]SBT57234.1 PIR Superfamily Protein [Plasmodium ovale wallikeri]